MDDEDRRRLPPRARQFIAHAKALREAMGEWAEHRGMIGTGGSHEGYGEIRFHWDTGKDLPESELKLWADLDEQDQPVIRVTFPEEIERRLAASAAAPATEPAPDAQVTSRAVVALHGTDLPTVEPEQACDGCGTRGTVGRAVRFPEEGEPEIHRFCEACWPEGVARIKARWQHEDRRARDAWMRDPGNAPGPPSYGTAIETATWDQVEEMLDQFRDAPEERGSAWRTYLRHTADALHDDRVNRVGTMPWTVAMFIRQHTTRELAPNFPDD